ncbi:hemophore-related protein, partial [Mycobacterium tuberculosis]
MRLSLTALSAGVGAVAMSLTVGAGVASADPVDAVINTTCNYGQVVAALNATDPGAAAQFNASPV